MKTKTKKIYTTCKEGKDLSLCVSGKYTADGNTYTINVKLPYSIEVFNEETLLTERKILTSKQTEKYLFDNYIKPRLKVEG